jgi:NAD(P)-dependent dehydrogenase (short-subunit alcohol dehydrogenase family)
MKIEGSVAFVTGGNRGLGLAFVKELVRRGATKVYAGVRNPSRMSLPGVIPVRIDITDAASVEAGAAECGDVTLLINNAGIGGADTPLDPALIDISHKVFDTNFYGIIRATQAFAPVLADNGGGAIVNVLSDVTWFARPIFTAYCAAKSAAWSYTNALRLELRDQGTQVLALHVGFLDTEMASGVYVKKSDPQDVAACTLDGLAAGREEVLADKLAQAAKRGLVTEQAYYLNPPPLGLLRTEPVS